MPTAYQPKLAGLENEGLRVEDNAEILAKRGRGLLIKALRQKHGLT